MTAHHDSALRATYGCGEHRCARCNDARALLVEATPRQARDNAWLCAGDLLCAPCDKALTADAEAIDEATLDAEAAKADGDVPSLATEIAWEPDAETVDALDALKVRWLNRSWRARSAAVSL